MKKERLQKVLNKMAEKGLSQAIISDPTSILYLTGFYLNPGERFYALYINQHGECKWFINSMFAVPRDDTAELIRFSDMEDPMESLKKVIRKGEVLGLDKNYPARFLLPILHGGVVSDVQLASVCVDEARASKDMEEIALMREASRVNDVAMEQFRNLIKPGVTELEVADQMMEIYRSLGAQEFSFEPIVGFGKNTAITHHRPDNTVIKEGDIVVLDVGCRKDWYCSDMTRVFFYKHAPTPEEKNIYDICRRSTEAGEDACLPGVTLASIDKAARDVIENAGYGYAFVHRTGHFIGLDDHDYGDVSANNQNLTVPGNIFSIEPAICLDEYMQIYIEDLVLITENGKEVLNHYSHDVNIIE